KHAVIFYASSRGRVPKNRYASAVEGGDRDSGSETEVGKEHLYSAMKITLYSSWWCPDCREAKRFLQRHKLPFTEIDIENTPGAAEEVVRRTGKRAIPQFVIDGEWIQPYRPGEGFLYEEMSKRLGVSEG